jgi:superfamily I DNA and/or RNA helicase
MLSNSANSKIEKEFENLRRELLDLTLRNQLLNFKSRARTVAINNQTPTNIFQTLILQENKMYFVANKKDKKEEKSSVWDHIPFDFSKFSEGNKRLETDLTPNELQKRLYYINNQAKTMLQEQGYNILYLAVGFLEWVDKSKPRQVNKAPLVLIPVSIERKKVGESFNLEWTGEDIQTNISLKAKLFEAGIELPDFEFKRYGEVIDHYIDEVKRAVFKMEKWNVNYDIALGFFSFTKFVMYNDLNPDSWADNVDLTKNELIQAIFNPAKNDVEAFNEEDIDSQLEYRTMYQVLDADSSQIAAIQDVKAGRNLVVEGPPGTGKSQTIVNLIAELLAEGKSVLFVSEKMAALDVVKDRLTNVGLGKFVLELHSHKTRRKKFIKDLEKATTVRAVDTLNIDQTIRKLETLKVQLDSYASVIHKPVFAVNLSAFQLYGMKESADDHFSRKQTIMPLVRFNSPETITLKDLDDIILSLESVAELYQTISKENPWSKCSPKSLLPADLREIEMLINDTLTSLDAFLVERGRVYDIYGIKKPETLNEFKKSLSAFDIIKSQNSELIDAKILKSGAWEKNNNDAFLIINELEKYQKVAGIFNKFNSNIYHVNIDGLIYQLNELSHKKLRFFKGKQHVELVEQYYSVPVPDNINTVINDLNQVKIAIKIKKNLEANEALAKSYYGDYWHLNADVNDLKSIAQWMSQFTSLINEGIFSQNTIDLLSKDLFDINPERDLVDYIDSGNEFSDNLDRLKSKLNPRSKLIFKKGANDVAFEDWQTQLYTWRGQLSSLHLWSQYLNTKNSLKGTTAELFVSSIEKRNIKKDDVKALVEGNFADSLLNILFVENHELATFIGELHENRIREFKDLDRKILVLNRKRIFHKLNSNIPQIFGATENPQAKVLAGEFTRKSGHLPVRKLLEKAGGMIKQIKPCFMMSPLSVAQYLDPTNEELQFDVVIFDEASQVKPEDALGAFMRGKTAVVMGDTQQLPPTSFFDQMASGESEEEEATSLDMESILHLCKLSFPVKMLKWHYRSRHESLINVSNREFYDNELLVYPSPSHNDPELGLKFHYNPDTAYDRGSSSANPREAEDVVEAIFDHFDRYGDTKSLGVGTFSVAQKNAILEKLEEKRRERPEFEPLFSENKDERFFVKNLETIQGDERDVILISVGYGFDNERKMSLNFGPLNQDGGERRLNVLITRARQKCVVFSNFKASSMKLTANPPHGVRALREFLEYAENLTMGTHMNDEHSSAPFEDAIASFLEENGYQVDKQIGCAGFRVDLAIVDEENPGKYILGITTDGKMYASSKVARDRDRLREQVLEGLGWKLYHLWSTDWYRNRDLGRKKLLDYIEKSIKETRKEQKIAREKEEKRRKEAEKRAEELRKKREQEIEEQRQKEAEAKNAMLGDDVDVIPPEGLDFDDDIIFVSPDDDNFDDDGGIEFVEESPSEFVEVEDDDSQDDVDVESPSEFVEVEDDDSQDDVDVESPSEFVVDEDSSVFDEYVFEDSTDDDLDDGGSDSQPLDDDLDDGGSDSQPLDDDLNSSDDETDNDSNNGSDDDSDDETDDDSNNGPDDDSGDDSNNDSGDDFGDEISIDFESDAVDEFDEEIINPLNDEEMGESDSEDIDIDDFIKELDDEKSDDDLSDSGEAIDDINGDDIDENPFGSDKDSSEDDSNEQEEKQEEITEEEVDDDGESSKVKFGSSLSSDDEDEGLFSSIKRKFSIFGGNSSQDEEKDIEDIIKEKLDEDEFIYVDHSYDDEIPNNDDLTDDIEEDIIDEPDEEIKNDSFAEDEIESDVIDEEIDNEIAVDDVEEDSIVGDGVESEPIGSELKQKPKVTFNKSTSSVNVDELLDNDEKNITDDAPDIKSSDISKGTIDDSPDSSDDYILVNHDDEIEPKSVEDKVDLGSSSDEDLGFEDNVDLGSDDDYIYVDHGDNEESIIDYSDDKNEPESLDNNADFDSDEDLESDDRVDLGSDDDYIYVDHSNDEESSIDYSDDENEPPEVEVNPLRNVLFRDRKPRNPNGIHESRFSNTIKGTPKIDLTKEEVQTVHGEVIDEEIEHKPAPSDDDVIEVEIISGDVNIGRKNNLFNQDIDDEADISNDNSDNVVSNKNIYGGSDMGENGPTKQENLDSILDEALDNNPEGTLDDEDISNLASAIVSKAFDDVLSNALDKKNDQNNQNYEVIDNDNEPFIQDNEVGQDNPEDINPTYTSPDGVTYYKGVNDVNSPLRKNNLYYDEDRNKNRSVKDSIRSGIRDIKYIHKSLNEIENPTEVGYVSVVDRTAEYDEDEYLTPIQDYEGEEYVPPEEGLTFAEEEELRYERELQMEKLKKEISSDDDTIVTIHEEERREDRKDQALEDIIQIADEDYKEIEKERFKSNNTLKAFDDNKLPKRGNIEDEIVDYKFASDIGLNSQKDLFEQPIDNVSNAINEIVNVEGPIHVDEVIKRVKDSCNIKRAGSKMKKQVNRAIKKSEDSGNILRIGDFLYDASSNDVIIRKRVKPKIEMISDEEIAKNIETILSHKQNVTTASLIREVSRNFGFKSTSRKTSARIKRVLDSMIADSTVKLDNDIVELN